MTAKILDGKPLSTQIKQQIKKRIADRQRAGLPAPGLAVILVGEDPASELYVRKKREACAEVGIISRAYHLKSNTSQTMLLDLITELNEDPMIHGILVQLPLPATIEESKIVEHIHPKKDVDGFHPYNLGRLAQQRPLFRPCTPAGIMLLLESTGLSLKGEPATVVGVSNIVGRPMVLELLMAGSTVTACHRQTQDLQQYVSQATILVVATGNPHLIKGHWIKPGAIVIDVGMNRLDAGHLVGDVEFETAQKRASYITPVPGGVGPMTVACLLKNTLFAAELTTEITSELNL